MPRGKKIAVSGPRKRTRVSGTGTSTEVAAKNYALAKQDYEKSLALSLDAKVKDNNLSICETVEAAQKTKEKAKKAGLTNVEKAADTVLKMFSAYCKVKN